MTVIMPAVEDFTESINAHTRYTIPQHLYFQIEAVKVEACSEGLSEEDIHQLIKVIVSRKLPNRCFIALLRCLIPKTTVSNASVKLMLSWATSNFFHSSDSVIVAVLQWICCLLEFDVAEKQAVDDFYAVFFFFLKKKTLIPFTCRIIHFLTKSDDVTRCSVSHVLATAKLTQGLKQPALAVLNLFKSFKPECVPEDIPPVSISVVFRKLPEIAQMYFGRAQERNEARQTTKKNELQWRTIASFKKKKGKFGQELIPPVDYINIGPSMYKDKTTHSLLKFSSFPELCSYQLSLAIPSNVMCLLANHAGRHIIAFGHVLLHSRFSHLLFNKLYDALILKESFPRDEIEGFLNSLVELEEYMQQGIPVVSKILSEYIIMSDGAVFQDHIFRLLEWVTASSYEDLYDCILHHLRNVFISVDSTQRCAMIRMFRRLVTNMYVSTLYRNTQSFEKPFLTCYKEWNMVVMLEKIIVFVHEELMMMGFAQFVDDYLFIEEVLTFCETVLYLQENSSLHMHIMIPPSVVSYCIFGHHYFLISRVHKLLERYKLLLKRYVEKENSKAWQKEQRTLQRSCKEFNSALFGSVEFPDTIINAVSNYKLYENLRKSFHLNHHFAFASHLTLACITDVLAQQGGDEDLPLAAVRNIFDIGEIEE